MSRTIDQHFQGLVEHTLSRNVAGVRAELREAWKTHKRQGLHFLLTTRQRLPPVSAQHRPSLMMALTVLLQDQLPSLALASWVPGQLLETLHEAYIGLPIHLAVALSAADIVEQLLDTATTLQLDASLQLTARDVAHNAALSLAARVGHWPSVTVLCDQAQGYPAIYRDVLRHCLAVNVPRLIYYPRESPNLEPLKEVVHRVKSSGDQFTPLYLNIFHAIPEEVENVLKRGELQNCSLQEPGPFHYASAVYDGGEDEHEAVLCILGRYMDLRGWTAPNDVSTLRVANTEHFNGTAAHFALLNFQPDFRVKHPGYVFQRRLDTGRETIIQCRDVDVTVDKMDSNLEICGINLAQSSLESLGVDIDKPNKDNKTPVDLLPPDTDYELIRYLLKMKMWQHGEGEPNTPSGTDSGQAEDSGDDSL